MDLPRPVINDLFSLDCRDIEMATGYLADAIERHGFTVSDSILTGVLITIPFNNASVTGTVIVNRLERSFSIEAITRTGEVFLPVNGHWRDINIYLVNLRHAAA